MKSRNIFFLAVMAGGLLVWGAVVGHISRADTVRTVTVQAKLPHNCPADTLVAVPVYNGNLSQLSMQLSKTVKVKQGEVFTLTLEKDRDWLLALMDSTARWSDQFIGLIAFSTADANTALLLLPISTAATSQLVMRELIASGNLWLTKLPLDPSLFSLTTEQLRFLADNDDVFLNVKNFLLNSLINPPGVSEDTSATYYTLRPDFSWYGNYAETQNAFMGPYWYSYRSYNFQLDSDSTEVTMNQVCGDGVAKVALELYPPAGSTVQSKNPTFIYSDQLPISNNNAVCAPTSGGCIEARDEDFFATNKYGNISYSFGTNLVTNPIPAGFWRYLVGGNVRALFDVAVAAPLTPGGQVNGLTTDVKINTDANGKMLSLDISWYTFDTNTQTYQPVTDISTLKYLVGSANIFLVNQAAGARRYESVSFNPSTQTNVAPQGSWYFGNSGQPQEQAEEVGVFYSSAGLGFFFKLDKFVYPVGVPSFILPLPLPTLSLVTKGQQFNSCWNNVTHTGLDFGFTPQSGSFLYYDVVVPADGLVMQVKPHLIGGNAAVDVEMLFNKGWGTFIAFEPFTTDPQIGQMQVMEISVFDKQVVKKGQTIGRLVVPETQFPHFHWQVYSIESFAPWKNTPVCPWTYCTVPAQAQLDVLFGNSALGIIGTLSGPYGPFTDACLPPPPPPCKAPD